LRGESWEVRSESLKVLANMPIPAMKSHIPLPTSHFSIVADG